MERASKQPGEKNAVFIVSKQHCPLTPTPRVFTDDFTAVLLSLRRVNVLVTFRLLTEVCDADVIYWLI